MDRPRSPPPWTSSESAPGSLVVAVASPNGERAGRGIRRYARGGRSSVAAAVLAATRSHALPMAGRWGHILGTRAPARSANSEQRSRDTPICRLFLPMRAEGLEPPRAFAHRLLRPACLPVPPRPRTTARRGSSRAGYDPSAPARVPKSVKGAVSKAAARKSLWVRVPPRAVQRSASR